MQNTIPKDGTEYYEIRHIKFRRRGIAQKKEYNPFISVVPEDDTQKGRQFLLKMHLLLDSV
jgi:hypothetical protein